MPKETLKTKEERLTAFYEWAKNNELTLKDLEAIFCGALIQGQVHGLLDYIEIAGRKFEFIIKEIETEKEESK